MTHYLEAMDRDGSWYILGSHSSSGFAQAQMHSMRKLFAWLPLRVSDIKTREIVVLNDPRGPHDLAHQ